MQPISRKVAYDVTHFAQKSGSPKTVIYAGKVYRVRRTPTLGVILKSNEKLIKNLNELLLVCYLETKKFNQKRFG